MENDNIIKIGDATVIMNGGNPLPGCPNSSEEAREIELRMNNGVEKDDDDYASSPKWSFDCGYKLDYDGGIVSISSRFYPPKTHYGSTWDGSVSVYLFEKLVEQKKFDCQTLEELKIQVDAYVSGITEKIRLAFNEQ